MGLLPLMDIYNKRMNEIVAVIDAKSVKHDMPRGLLLLITYIFVFSLCNNPI